MVTVQAPVPEQPPPLQPTKANRKSGVAVSVTWVPLLYAAEQVFPQLIPAGLEVTVPLPVPSRITERLGRLPTVSVVLPLRPPEVAVITVDPGLPPVANPAALIVATVVSLLVHVTPRPTTVTGVNAFVVVPFPRRRSSLRPQHRNVPSARSEQV